MERQRVTEGARGRDTGRWTESCREAGRNQDKEAAMDTEREGETETQGEMQRD